MTSPRSLQRATTRRQLVDAGLRVVAEKGFAATSTAAIAQATGKAHGTVFVHFPTRDDLVAALVAELGRGISERLSDSQSAAPTLPQVLDAHLAALADHEVLYARLLGEGATLPAAARAHLFALQAGVASRIWAAYARSRRKGTVRRIEPATLSNIWISLTNHYLMNRDLFAPGGSVIAKAGASIKAQFLAFTQLEKGST